LVAVYGHRYIPAEPGLAGNPVFSIHQSDVIVYGSSLASYLAAEFGVVSDDERAGLAPATSRSGATSSSDRTAGVRVRVVLGACPRDLHADAARSADAVVPAGWPITPGPTHRASGPPQRGTTRPGGLTGVGRLSTPTENGNHLMIAFGIFLLLVAALNPHARVLGGIGVICIVVGLILEVLGTIGHAVGGRRHYY
jgi:hypothetical protein